MHGSVQDFPYVKLKRVLALNAISKFYSNTLMAFRLHTSW